jgi:perosamine synthetase
MPERVIPSFRAEFSEPEIAEVTAATEQILRSGQLILGPYTRDFEAAMADVSQTEHAVAVNSGSTALEVAYKTLNVRDRQVLIPTNTNFATAAAAAYAGAKVEFYDNGLYPNLADIEERLTEDTAGLVVVHIGGYMTSDMERLAQRCEELGVPLIEDAAHAHGASLRGKAAGSFGHAAAFSFFPTKTLTTGEGGIITTNDAELAAKARQYRDQGKESDGVTHTVWGNSWRMTEMGAALGLAQVRSIRTDNARRAEIIDRYETELVDTALEFPEQGVDAQPAGYKCVALLPEGVARDGIKAAMKARGVLLGKEVYEKPLHHQPVFEQFTTGETYATADDFAERHICLPLWRFMEDRDVTTVIEQLHAELG